MSKMTKCVVSVGVAVLMALSAEIAFAAVGEIVVTARKREESLMDAPVAVSAYTQELLSENNIFNIDDLARAAPGFQFEKSFGRTADRPAVRGTAAITTPDFGLESGTSIFIDGVYYPGDISAFDLSNMERVEIVRGPQSALYGRNSYGGAINFITQKPSDEYSVRLTARGGATIMAR